VHRQLRITGQVGCAALIASLIGGCGINSEELFVKPGTYEYYDCASIAKAQKAAEANEVRLRELIARAEQEPIGVLVAAAAYRTQYLTAKGQIRQLEDAAQQKNCPATEPTPAAPPSTVAKSKHR